MRILEGLKPERVFYYFEEISKIPRESGNEKEISDYLLSFAKEKGLEVFQDEVYNIIIKKPGTTGYEDAPICILQGHMDMVCEKNEGLVHDFNKDPIKLRLIEDYIYATDTTLGADNGIAVAMCLSLLESNEEHPPLEVVITADEEVGMTGAENLKKENLSGNILINLDSEGEGVFTAGCAGGNRVEMFIPIAKVEPKYRNFYCLSIRGLDGGHSGLDIDKEKGNANKLIGRVLYDLKDFVELAYVNGGSKDNAIPREASVIISCDDEIELNKKVILLDRIFKNEYAVTDNNVELVIEKEERKDLVYSKEVFNKLVTAILLIPSGVVSKSTEIDLVISSNNLGVIKEEENNIVLINAGRTSVDSLLVKVVNEMKAISDMLDIRCIESDNYPGWEYKTDSRIREVCTRVYKNQYNEEPLIEAIHAGLECGFFTGLIEGLDAISFGPEMHDIHTPNEHISISSIERTYKFLCNVLKEIK